MEGESTGKTTGMGAMWKPSAVETSWDFLVRTLVMEDTESEEAIFCNQARCPVSHICPACKMGWGKGGSELVGVAKQ